jgi:hypothetical protein
MINTAGRPRGKRDDGLAVKFYFVVPALSRDTSVYCMQGVYRSVRTQQHGV